MSKKRVTIAVLSISIIYMLIIGGTLAYFTERDAVINTFAAQSIDIIIAEPNWDPDNGVGMRPGYTIMKDPTVTCTLNKSFMRAVVEIIDMEETIPNPAYTAGGTEPKTIANPDFRKRITDPDRLALILSTMRYDPDYNAEGSPITPNIDITKGYTMEQASQFNTYNIDSFIKDNLKSGAGIYYYTYLTIFNEGDSAVLFSNIIIPFDWDSQKIAKAGKFRIDVYAQAIQVDGFASPAEAFAVYDDLDST